MAHGQRMEEFRRRRYRTAVRRRGVAPRRPPAACRAFRGFLHQADHRPGEDTRLRSGLWHVAQRVHRYPGVAGLLYRHQRDRVEVLVVAPRPITGLLRVLTATWNDEIQALHPEYDWDLVVSPSSPEDEGQYRCLYWRHA